MVHEGLRSELVAPDRGDHFMVQSLPDLIPFLRAHLTPAAASGPAAALDE